MRCLLSILLAFLALPLGTQAATYNLKVVTDASPDYSDLPSLVRSATDKWKTPEEKCWAMFYWNHIARRQTAPMELHGMALTDPIRQFNDYGYTMCSTISGINCSIWDAMGMRMKYWDISNHTVPEVEYDGAWHMYDNSMTAIYTRCDGRTVASVAEIGATGACAASSGKSEPGHIAKYHCLMATSPLGFLSGADTIRGLDEEYRCFNPNGLKFRSYFYDWDRGHRYILNLRERESYNRFYHSLGKTPDFYVPNSNGKDPEAANERYHLRGNGVWKWKPTLTPATLPATAFSFSGVQALNPGGLAPEKPGESGAVIFKLEGANVITALRIEARFRQTGAGDAASLAVSVDRGRSWREIWRNDAVGDVMVDRKLVAEVNGSYEVLVKAVLLGKERATDAQLRDISFETTTMLNSKTQPKLNLGRNTIYLGAGDPTESIVLWPDLQGTNYQSLAVAETNLATRTKHPGYMGTLFAARPKSDAWVVFRLEAPRDISQLNYGGRLYNRARGSHIDFLHSFDEGKTWNRSYSLTNTDQPWDVIHFETVNRVPPGTRSVLCKYLLNGTVAGSDACSLYAVRMEADYRPADAAFRPIDVTFSWKEVQPDYSTKVRSHTERVTQLPHRYQIHVGGADHPVMESMRLACADTDAAVRAGYSDGTDAGGERFIQHRVVFGKNLALGRPYTVSIPSREQWGAGDPEGKRLTDGIIGPPYPGGTAPSLALLWNKGDRPEVTVDLGEIKKCGAFRIQLGAGWPWWDALKGEFKDQVEVLISNDGREFASEGRFDLNLRWKDLPVNHFWPDDEAIAGHPFELILAKPVDARFVRFRITPERSLTVSEVEAFDSIRYEPFDLRIALPDETL